MTDRLKIMRQNHREAIVCQTLFAKIIGSWLSSRLGSEGAGRAMQHKDQRERTVPVWTIRFDKNIMPVHFYDQLAILIGAEVQ